MTAEKNNLELGRLRLQLQSSLASLPGPRAQEIMAPRPRHGATPPTTREEEAQVAAVLLPLYEKDRVPHVLLTVRSADLPSHRGQVSLPGGVREPAEGLQEAALRETREEVGIPPGEIEILGALSPLFIPPSGFLLHPFVGVVQTSIFHPSPREVARLLEVPLDVLRSSHRHRVETRMLKGGEFEVPYFDLGDEKIWGATAMVLAEFLWILGAAPEPW